MNKLFFIAISIITLTFSACEKKDDDMEHEHTEFDYHAHIVAPNTDDKHVDDTLIIDVLFESHAGETVHHINIRIYNKDTGAEIYNEPGDAHIHETSGQYEYQDTFPLSETNGVMAHSDWVLEAKVWGHEAGEGEVTETVEFHVHPK